MNEKLNKATKYEKDYAFTEVNKDYFKGWVTPSSLNYKLINCDGIIYYLSRGEVKSKVDSNKNRYYTATKKI